MASRTRVLVVGLDAMDVDIARSMVAAGQLPDHRVAAGHGGLGRDRPAPGVFVGSVWPSFATGTSPDRHGLYGWRQLLPGTYSVGRVDGRDVRRPPFWALSDAHLQCAVIDVPITPVVPEMAGVQLIDWGSHDRFMPFETSPRATRPRSSIGSALIPSSGRLTTTSCGGIRRSPP